MSEPILITCTACKKQLKVPARAAGKKVRCKNCKAVVPVPEQKALSTFEAEIESGKNPYLVTETSIANQCPFCAHDIDPPDAMICLNCGFDLVHRHRRESKVVYERTALDFVKWHLPTLGCFLGIVAIFVAAWYYHYKLPYDVLSQKWADEIVKDRWTYFDNDQAEWTGLIFHWGIEIWGIVIGLFMMTSLVWFMFKRLVYNFLPPEKEKRMFK